MMVREKEDGQLSALSSAGSAHENRFKLLEFCFSKRELTWLDDFMPESKRKKDAKKKKQKEVFQCF